MATYKVLQDVEAEDKLVGPLTLRQFIYAIICIFCCYLIFLTFKEHVPFLAIVLLPPVGVMGFFAFPWGREQPTELWALARIRFLFKPRKRIWDQSGLSDYVTVTVPKRIEHNYTNGLSETEVSSRLKALADVIDSHGWATKNVDPAQVMTAMATGTNPADSDRLVGVNTLPEIPAAVDTAPSDDILDERNNPVAMQFDQMLDKADVSHRERIMAELDQTRTNAAAAQQATSAMATPTPNLQSVAAASATPSATQPQQNNYWFTNQPQAPAAAQQASTTSASIDEHALAEQLRAQAQVSNATYSHMHTVQLVSDQPIVTLQPPPQQQVAAAQPQAPAPAPVTPKPNPATLNYVNNDDLSIATIARQVNQNPPDEVVISLH